MTEMMNRLHELAERAAETARTTYEEPCPGQEFAEALIETGLFLARRKLFPEAREASPFGRLERLPGGKARIIPPGRSAS
jgi:hypothetical protein